MRRVWITLLAGILGTLSWSPGQASPSDRYATVAVAPSKTSIYIGSVTLTTPPFVRNEGRYETTYSAKVFPYFFYSEKGRMWISVSDEDLARLARGETIQFEGKATNEKGKLRGISGRAVPTDASSGKIKVRVHVTADTELIFNTTYRFAGR